MSSQYPDYPPGIPFRPRHDFTLNPDADLCRSDWGDFRYNLQCTSGGCSGDGVQTQWYPDTTTNDPSGWVGGVVDDQGNSYVGSFVAEKD